jgi:hypothetical protein
MIIVVLGLPGSGKSYFAEKLADRLEALYLNSDQTRDTLGARGKYSAEDKMIVYTAMAERATQALADGKRVVVDATFYQRSMVEMFQQLARQYLSPICFIRVEADEQLIRSRLSNPRTYSEADFSVYKKIKEEFEPLSVPYLSLQSKSENVNQMLEVAMDYIGQVHE